MSVAGKSAQDSQIHGGGKSAGGAEDEGPPAREVRHSRKKRKKEAGGGGGGVAATEPIPEREDAPPAETHARSLVEARRTKVSKQISKVTSPQAASIPSVCRQCGKNVFAVEAIKAEKDVWHRHCFRCSKCNRQLQIDSYCSHEGDLFCKLHFRELLQPKAVPPSPDEQTGTTRKSELIVSENTPQELPPDVIRACEKTDSSPRGLSADEVKHLSQYFQQKEEEAAVDRGHRPLPVTVSKSASILNKIARFTNGTIAEDDGEQDGGDEAEDGGEEEAKVAPPSLSDVVPCKELSSIRQKFEHAQDHQEELLQRRREDKQRLRARLSLGRHSNLKEQYERNLGADEGDGGDPREQEVSPEAKTSHLRALFEHGGPPKEQEAAASEYPAELVKGGLSDQARSKFLELDRRQGAAPSPAVAAPAPRKLLGRSSPSSKAAAAAEVIRCDAVAQETPAPADVAEKFRFFENYGSLPQQPLQGDDGASSPSSLACPTTRQMLDKFLQLERGAETVEQPTGLPPLKSFTPPPGDPEATQSDEDASGEEDEKAPPVEEDIRAQLAERARSLKSKFEHWNAQQQSASSKVRSFLEEEAPSLDTTRKLREKFESHQAAAAAPVSSAHHRVPVRRFV